MSSSSSSSGGVGFFGLLFIVFLVLKLTDVIAWSWWWVTAPLWGGLVFVVAILATGAALIGALHLYEGWGQRRRRRLKAGPR